MHALARNTTVRATEFRETMMPTSDRIDNFFAMQSARSDRWRDVLSAAQKWATGQGRRADVEQSLAELTTIEEFHAYPGVRRMDQLREKIAAGDAAVVADLVRKISDAILTGAYAHQAESGEAGENGDVLQDVLPSVITGRETRRPYFEVFSSVRSPPRAGPPSARRSRRLRRVEDAFIYEPVIVGSFEDAICAPSSIPRFWPSSSPKACRSGRCMTPRCCAGSSTRRSATVAADTSALKLAGILKGIRPDLDIYVTTDREVEKLASDPAASCARRIFYAVEEVLELHLAILEGIQERYETPFFDNLKRYAQRPIGTFHALPIARGKSVFRSEWIRDMGEFYGINLFLAESSATTGGLDSLLEPTGNIKKSQDMAARAFGADHVFFVTNGTSTSNKMVVQALVAPGDIVIVDRNCHKSHHYGLVLGGGQPLYVEAFPLTQYSMYGAVPLAAIKKALLDLRDEGRLDRVRMLDLTNCTFDGHMYNTRRVMEECLAIKPDLIFLWDEAWSGFARWSPFLRPRTGMGAAAAIEEWLLDPASVAAYEKQQKELGAKPSREKLMTTRLIPDPRKVRLRVYQTNSTHKSMSAIRQGSMVLVKDVDFGSVESQFHEAVFTHASTSPNQQLIAEPRRGPAADGAGGLWPGDERDLDRAEDQDDRQDPSGDLEVLPYRSAPTS